MVDLNLYAYPDTTLVFHFVHKDLTKLAWIAAGLVAGLVFRKGDYLRKTWLLYAIYPFLLILFDVVLLFRKIAWFDANMDAIQGGLSTLANAIGVVAVYRLSSAWKVAGLSLPGSTLSKNMLRAVTALAALMVLGHSIFNAYSQVATGNYLALNGLAAAVGDSISLVLIVPLILTAMSLRGSIVSWPWILFTIGLVCWITTDLLYLSLHQSNIEMRTLRTIIEVMRTLASAYTFSAGLAQRFVVREIQHDLGESKIG